MRLLRELGLAWRRAALVPLRLIALCLGLLMVLAALGWNIVNTRELLRHQQEAALFVSQQGWRVSVRPQVSLQNAPSHTFNDSPELQTIDLTQASMWVMTGMAAVRAPQRASVQYYNLIFANPKSGMAASDAAGNTLCAWVGPGAPLGAEWIVEQRLRCRVVVAPKGWLSIAAEIEQAALVLPIEAAPLAQGQHWRRAVQTLLVAGESPCLDTSHDALLRCESFSANRSAQAVAGKAMGLWNAWVLPVALVAALVAVLVYLHGLAPVLETEFALRVALGAGDAGAVRWMIGAVLAQWIWVMLAVAVPTLMLIVLTGVNMARSDGIFCLIWAVACGCLGVVMLVGRAWSQRHYGLQMLGRVG